MLLISIASNLADTMKLGASQQFTT